ncbi:MAG: VCBS repeat-containing protein [Planctomycetota bacterium]
MQQRLQAALAAMVCTGAAPLWAQTTVPGSLDREAHIPAPVRSALEGLEPSAGVWDGEIWNSALNDPIKALRAQAFLASKDPGDELAALALPDAPCLWLAPDVHEQSLSWRIWTGKPADAPRTWSEGLRDMRARMGGAADWMEWHVEDLEVLPDERCRGRLRLQWKRSAGGENVTMHSLWEVTWQRQEQAILWAAVEELEFHLVGIRSGNQPAFVDRTAGALGAGPCAEQLGRSIPEWRDQLDANLGVGFLGHHGIAVADVDGDGLEDLYVCEPGGLPNRLLLHQPDGSLVDVAKQADLDILNYSSSALWLDFDGDGDRDLALCTSQGLYLFEQHDKLRFRMRFHQAGSDCTSMAAADPDGDGDLDLYVCRYASPYESQGLPFPYHDAENGSENWMFANQGQWNFEDVTEAWGSRPGRGAFPLRPRLRTTTTTATRISTSPTTSGAIACIAGTTVRSSRWAARLASKTSRRAWG